MGNSACCAAKAGASAGADALRGAEAVPVGDDRALGARRKPAEQRAAINPPDVAEFGQYIVTIDRHGGGDLGLNVDYMPERAVLPILSVTGGLAADWNARAPAQSVFRAGDSIVSVNGTRGDATAVLNKCLHERLLTIVVAKALTYDHLVADLVALVKTMRCGPILVRLSWHDAGVFARGRGGCPNAALRFPDRGEGAWAANAGLPTVALELLQPIARKYVPRLLSNADLWALAANIAIASMGGPDIRTRFGRVDAKHSGEGCASNDGRLPDAAQGAEHLRAVFRAKGLDDRAIVALSGAHTVGRCHAERSGFDGAWTEDPLKFDNAYFRELLAKSYSRETTETGASQCRHAASGTIMLNSDLALLSDPAFKAHVEEYARDQPRFFADFAAAWTKLQESGAEGLLRDVL